MFSPQFKKKNTLYEESKQYDFGIEKKHQNLNELEKLEK